VIKFTSIAFIFFLCLIFFSCRKPENDLDLQAVQINLPTQFDLEKILFVNDSVGYIVGGNYWYAGFIMSTHDGGNEWKIDTTTQKHIYNVKQSNVGEVYVCGLDGFVYKLVQKQWQLTHFLNYDYARSLACKQDTCYFCYGIGYVGGGIYKTTDHQIIRKDTTLEEQEDILLYDDSTIISCGYASIYKSDKYGNNWHQIDVKGDFFKSIFKKQDGNLIVIGYKGNILTSEDKGESWKYIKRIANFSNEVEGFRAINFYNNELGVIVGDDGLVWITKDGGTTWLKNWLSSKIDFYGVDFKDESTLFCVGKSGLCYKVSL